MREAPPGHRARMPTTRTLGVEEELLLVDPGTGRLTAVAEHAVRANDGGAEVEKELFLQMIETSTPPVTSAEELLEGLRRGRRAVGLAAASAGVRAVAVPTPPLPAEAALTPTPRYRRIGEVYGELAQEAMVCAMHVHVDVADDDEAVRVVDGVRPWLPLLLALSANSPYHHGVDTGHASWRSQVWGRWASAGQAEPFGDLRTYREVAERTVEWGGALDAGMLYFDARPAASLPTAEIRVADVCTDLDDAVLVALLARGLVSAAAEGPPPVAWRGDLLRVATWRAARYGIADALVHPVEQRLAPAREVFAAAVAHAREPLEASGDLDLVTEGFERLVARGGGATRQRRVREERGDLSAVVEDLARRTEESWA